MIDHINAAGLRKICDLIASKTARKADFNEHAGSKSNPHGVTKSQVGLGNVPNVSTDNQTPTYTVAANLGELSSGEKLSTAFGKIAKAVKTIIVHIADNARHITAAERTAWNGKAAGNHTHSAATQSAAGLMSAEDKIKLDGLSTYAKGIRGYTFLSDLKAGKYLKVLSVQLGDYRYYKYFTALLALNSFFASGSSSDKNKLDMIVSLDAKQSSTNLDNIEFYAYSNAVPAMFNTERFIAAYKRVNTTDVLFEVYIRLVYDYEYFSANVINSYTLPASPIDFPMALVDEIPSDMTTSTLYVNKTDINAPSATAEKAGLMSAADKVKLDNSVADILLSGKVLTVTKTDGSTKTITLS